MSKTNLDAILAALFVASLVIAGVTAHKISSLFDVTLPAAVFAYSVTFLCTDVISELYGPVAARRLVLSEFVALAAAMGYVELTIAMPGAFDSTAYDKVMSGSWRIAVASLAAYTIAQNTDVAIFHIIKRAMGGRHLWLRNCASTMTSQLLDSTLFMTFAFYGVFPIGEAILAQWAVKLAIAALDTPFVYALVHVMRGNVPSRGVE